MEDKRKENNRSFRKGEQLLVLVDPEEEIAYTYLVEIIEAIDQEGVQHIVDCIFNDLTDEGESEKRITREDILKAMISLKVIVSYREIKSVSINV